MNIDLLLEVPKRYYPYWGKKIIKEFPKCRICGTDKNLCVHHIDESWLNNHLNNLIVLCSKCHMKHHGKKRIYKEKIVTINQEISFDLDKINNAIVNYFKGYKTK